MLLHVMEDTEFEIYHDDTLTNDGDMLRETNAAKTATFGAVMANPPFSYRWEPGAAMAEDMRFKGYGVAPKSAADFAFLLHGLHYLKDDEVMAPSLASISPHVECDRDSGTSPRSSTHLISRWRGSHRR